MRRKTVLLENHFQLVKSTFLSFHSSSIISIQQISKSNIRIDCLAYTISSQLWLSAKILLLFCLFDKKEIKYFILLRKISEQNKSIGNKFDGEISFPLILIWEWWQAFFAVLSSVHRVLEMVCGLGAFDALYLHCDQLCNHFLTVLLVKIHEKRCIPVMSTVINSKS